jgi:hypothetical protein
LFAVFHGFKTLTFPLDLRVLGNSLVN